MNIGELIKKLHEYDPTLPVVYFSDYDAHEIDEYELDIFTGKYAAVRNDGKLISLHKCGKFLALNNIADTEIDQRDYIYHEH